MWSISSQPTTRWQFTTDEEMQQWQQLAQRHHQAIIRLRQQGASWHEQLAQLQLQLSEICALHQTLQARQPVAALESTYNNLVGIDKSIRV